MTAADLATAARCRRRAALLRQLRHFFDQRDFLEVDTPVALAAPAPEFFIDPPAVDLPAGMGQAAQRLYLQASPELAMKRLLAAGLPRLYQIAVTFRCGDFSPLHRPEFRLLEWYRRDADQVALQNDCEALLCHLLEATQDRGDLEWPTQGKRQLARPPYRRLSLQEAFWEHAGFSLVDCVEAPAAPGALPCGNLPALRAALRRAGIPFGATDAWDELFHRAFLARIEPALAAATQPVFVTDFPAPLASLAKLRPDEPRLAERFELYVAGIELANGFSELTCAATQRQRFVEEGQRRAAAGKARAPLDEAFLADLAGLPRAAGIAMGLERLMMVLWDVADIGATRCLPEVAA